jgi:hypothetical protein
MGASQLLGSREGCEWRGDAAQAAAPGSRDVTESLSLRHEQQRPAPAGFFCAQRRRPPSAWLEWVNRSARRCPASRRAEIAAGLSEALFVPTGERGPAPGFPFGDKRETQERFVSPECRTSPWFGPTTEQAPTRQTCCSTGLF